jgi:hypothetical protein
MVSNATARILIVRVMHSPSKSEFYNQSILTAEDNWHPKTDEVGFLRLAKISKDWMRKLGALLPPPQIYPVCEGTVMTSDCRGLDLYSSCRAVA